MILGDTQPAPHHGSRISIHELFRHVAARRPDAVALVDAPNREWFTDGPPRRLTFAEADRMVSAIAGRLARMGLPIDTIVGIQLPNIAENILTILGVLRAGMIAAPMPLLWRSADAVAAMARVGAKALITCRRVGNFEHCRLAARVAADVLSIRYVCGFGENRYDGVVPLDDLFTIEKLDLIPLLARDGNAAAHLAVISFEIGEDGPVPVARRHLELLAGGMCVLSEGHFQPYRTDQCRGDAHRRTGSADRSSPDRHRKRLRRHADRAQRLRAQSARGGCLRGPRRTAIPQGCGRRLSRARCRH
ncbi:MAG: AMP-binding protein [Xanthobacteraceae bacterium]